MQKSYGLFEHGSPGFHHSSTPSLQSLWLGAVIPGSKILLLFGGKAIDVNSHGCEL